MDPSTLRIDSSDHRLRRVGRLVRRRLRIDGHSLSNGIHTDGRLSVVISGLRSGADGRIETFQWWSDRPVAMVIVRSTVEGEDVAIVSGPIRYGTSGQLPDGVGVRYVAFCYDTEPDTVAVKAREPRQSAASLLVRLLRSGSPA